jgi:hypothetical protein
MDREAGILLVMIAAFGMLSMLVMLRRQRIAAHAGPRESQFAVSTEGEKRCLKCGLGNLVTSATCAGCGTRLPG